MIIFFKSTNFELLFNVALIIFSELSNGNISQILANTSPTKSFEKYIPLVKQTSCTTMLPTPPVAFSLTKLPINIPSAINKTDITIDTRIVYKILILMFSPKIVAIAKNSMSCKRIIGIIDKIYPIIKSEDFIGDIPNLVSNDESLSFAINVAVNNVINEKPKEKKEILKN